VAGNGFSAGWSSCANRLARLPWRLRNGRDDPALHDLNAHLRLGFAESHRMQVVWETPQAGSE
jgi:hypothetical protein